MADRLNQRSWRLASFEEPIGWPLNEELSRGAPIQKLKYVDSGRELLIEL